MSIFHLLIRLPVVGGDLYIKTKSVHVNKALAYRRQTHPPSTLQYLNLTQPMNGLLTQISQLRPQVLCLSTLKSMYYIAPPTA